MSGKLRMSSHISGKRNLCDGNCRTKQFSDDFVVAFVFYRFRATDTKDFVIGLTGLIATKKSNVVVGAAWHGKLNTVLLFVCMALHLIWQDLPFVVSLVLQNFLQ